MIRTRPSSCAASIRTGRAPSRQARRGEPSADGSEQTADAPEPDDGDQRPAPFGVEELPRSVLPSPVIDTRRYRWMIGIFGLTLVVIVSIYPFLHNGVATTGSRPASRCTTSPRRWPTRT